MVFAKNYETVSTFVEVIQKKTVASFFRTRCTQLNSPPSDCDIITVFGQIFMV